MVDGPFQRVRRFLAELKRRKVYRVAVTYAVVGFVLIQVADLTYVRLGLPSWTVTFVIVLVAVGFPLSLVLAWAFEVTPEGVRRTPKAETADEPEAEAGTRTGYKALVGLGLVAAAVVGGWYLTGGGGESPEVTDGTVAALPFQVSGSASEEWRDGMVSLLSTGLDGATGLRAIPDQTVLATWERSGPDKAGVTVEEALEAARRTGARYGVVGTVTGLGSELQLSAAAYETTSRDRLGQVEVTGPPDSVTALAGELNRRVLGLLAAETGKGLEAADLASVMTHSDSALKAFLAGERHRRAIQTSEAIDSYRAAIRADSGFALPYARLAHLGIWRADVEDVNLRQARELSDQLPPRQRRLVRALYLARVDQRTLAAADSLRRLTEDYPDDPSMWNNRAELVLHDRIPRGWPEIDRAYERAVELDPGYTAYYSHYVESAFRFHHDSAIVAERVDAVPNDQWRRIFRLAQDAIYGDSTARQRAISAYDTVSVPHNWLMWRPLTAPQDAGVADTVYRRLMKREDMNAADVAPRLFFNDLRRGHIDQALADLRQWEAEPDLAACVLVWALSLDLPVPDSTAVRDLRGYRAWKRGDLGRAAELWDQLPGRTDHGAIWRGDLYRERGQLETAEGWYAAAWSHPVAHERLGQLYEEMGEPEKAAAAYRRFIEAWEDADPELQDRVEAASERLQALTGSKPESDE